MCRSALLAWQKNIFLLKGVINTAISAKPWDAVVAVSAVVGRKAAGVVLTGSVKGGKLKRE